MSLAEWVQGDSANQLVVTINDSSNNPIDLTGATVVVLFYINAQPPIVQQTMTLSATPTDGKVTYNFLGSDLNNAGILYWRVKITFGNGSVLTYPDWQTITLRGLTPS